MGKRDIPAAVVEILTPQGSLGTWLISEFVGKPQAFTLNNRKIRNRSPASATLQTL
jgi:hypothetical protein